MNLIESVIFKIDDKTLDLLIDYKIINKDKICQEHLNFYNKSAFFDYIYSRSTNTYRHYNQDELFLMSIYHNEEQQLIIELTEQQGDENNSILALK